MNIINKIKEEKVIKILDFRIKIFLYNTQLIYCSNLDKAPKEMLLYYKEEIDDIREELLKYKPKYKDNKNFKNHLIEFIDNKILPELKTNLTKLQK